MLVVTMTFFGGNALKCVSMNNQECKIRPQVVNINSDNPFFYPYSIEVNKCCGSCNINNPYGKLYVPNVVKNISKNMNVKVFNLVWRTNRTRHIEWHETCKCKCTLDARACNNKQHWNENKCRCECKE